MSEADSILWTQSFQNSRMEDELDLVGFEKGLYGFSVSINELVIPAKLIEDHLAHYCTSLGVWTGDDYFPIYLPGSATLLKYKNRYFMICTRHQLNDTPNFDSVCLMVPHDNGRTKCITSGGVSWFNQSNDSDHQQVVAFDFTEPCENIPELKPLFFDFRQQHPDMPANMIVAFITYGYLTSRAGIDYENGKIAQVKARIRSRLGLPALDDSLHVIEPITQLNFDPDGMSGGPSFCIVKEQSNSFSAHFAGITVRGGQTRLMIIKAGAVQAMLNTLIRD